MKKMILNFTTDTGGDATADGERSILGKLYAVEYRPAATSDATLTLTCTEWGGVSKALLTKASAGASNVWYYPRDIPHGTEDGAVLTATAGGDRVLPLLAGIPHLVVSSGGNTLSGTMILFFEQ
jgi:hypothetical protein